MFVAFLAISVPFILFSYLNQATISVLLEGKGLLGEQTGTVLTELMSLETTVEELGDRILAKDYQGVQEGLKLVGDVRISLSIVENLLGDGTRDAKHLEQLRQGVAELEQIVFRCQSDCQGELENLRLLQQRLDSLVEQSLSDEVKRGNSRAAWTLIGIVGLLLVTSYLLSSRLSSQLESLEKATRAMSDGNLNSPLPIPSNDEIGRLVTTFREMRERLKTSTVTRHYLETLLEAMGEGVIVTDVRGIVEYLNSSATRLLSSVADIGVGKPLTLNLERAMGGDERQIQVPLLNSGNECRHLTITTAPLFDLQHSLTGFVYGVNDITERQNLEQAVAKHREKLARGERIMALGTLGAIVAHKLSQPISSTKLFIQQALRGAKQGERHEELTEPLQDALQEISRVADAVKLMMMTRQGGSVLPSFKCSVVMEEMIQSVLNSMSESFKRYNATVSFAPGAVKLPVHCREVEFEEMMYCLLMNALQAGLPGQQISVVIDVSYHAQVGVVTISDNCSGIPEESIDEVFDFFFTTKPEEQGTGLGLAIVRHVTESHGGSVKVTSKAGEGTQFAITLPLVREQNVEESIGLHS
jgi:two-component system, OmpR family, sensor histidine kinase ResE